MSQQSEVDDWNESHDIGQTVKYWPRTRRDEPKTGKTKSNAAIMCNTAVVFIEGHSGCIALSHVQAT